MRALKRSRGMMLAEILTTLTIFGTIMSAAVSYFILSQGYYFTWSAQIDTLSGSQQAVKRLAAELQETHAASIQFSSTRSAVVFLSARSTTNGKFQTSSSGIPNWQKWVCYYLTPDPNGPYSLLIRKESQTIFGGLPNTVPPSAPSTWLSQFQNASGSQWTVASGVSTFDIEDIGCGISNSPLYIQVISTNQYRGNPTSYNPGFSVTGWGAGCVGKTGNWIRAQVVNP